MPKPKKIQPGCEHCDEEHNPDIPCRNAPIVNEYRVRSREVRESWYTVTGTDALDAMRRHTEKLSKRTDRRNWQGNCSYALLGRREETMTEFTEYYRFRWYSLNIADGDFSYLWYGMRYTTNKTISNPTGW